MTRILAIAALAVRTAIRSRLLLTLVVLLVLSVVLIPATVKGDGTLAGRLRILLHYSLGLTALILSLATLWAACGSVSQEVEGKQIQLTAVKPVPRWQLWLGKWVGLLALNAALLLLAGVVTWGFARWQTRAGAASERERQSVREEILVGRRLMAARPPDVEAEAAVRLEQFRRAGQVPPQMAPGEALALVRNRILAEQSAVVPGASKAWIFDPPRGRWPASGRYVWLRVRFSAGFSMAQKPINGVWSLGPVEGPPRVTLRMTDASGGAQQFRLPASALPKDEACVVRFSNAERAQSDTVMFDRDQGAELLIPESSFKANLARALLVIGCRLALLAALGLTAGVLFSFPVAAFVAGSALVIAMAAHYFAFASSPEQAVEAHRHNHGGEAAPTHLQVAGEMLGRQLDRVVAPVLHLDPLDSLSDGILVSWGHTGKAVGLMAVLYPAVFWTLGGYFLRRRELAAG